MFVSYPITNSAFTLHKPMNNQSFSNPNPNPIIRTLSADMSSPNWLQHNSISTPLKRAHSSDRLSAPFEEEQEQEQEQGQNKQIIASEDDQKKCAFEDIWSSILSQNGSGSSPGSGHLPPPYVHPMVKRTSSLTEKSLEICTESLGSETGSGGFSFPVNSEPEDSEKGSETTEDQVKHGPSEEVNGSSHLGLTMDPSSLSLSLSLSPRVRSSFPPPLSSLASPDGSNVHLKSHRQNGRLVLEAVAVPSQNCLKAQRHDGRLLLTLSGDDDDVELENDALEVDNDEELEEIECSDEYQEMGKEVDDMVKDGDRSCLNSSMGMVNVKQGTTPALIMSKFKWLSTTRARNVNVTMVDDKAEVDQHKSLLPPRPKMAHDGPMSMATCNSVLNGYEYYWRQTATAMGMLKPLARQQNLSAAPQVVENESKYMSKLLLGHNSEKSYTIGQEKQDVVVVKALETRTIKGDQREKEGEYLVPFLKGCKDSKRSFLLWGPHCIATS